MVKLTVFCVLLTFVLFHQARCVQILEKGVTDDERTKYIEKHNDLRLLIAKGLVKGQPRGTNLKRLKYSKILEQKAQEIADKCQFRHETVTGTQFQHVGQNLYISMSSHYLSKGADWNASIQSWFDENQLYKFGDGFRADTGHYTQVVWANTEYVGCGYTCFKSAGAFPFQKLYVCNYGPAGNWIGERPYKTDGRGCENLC